MPSSVKRHPISQHVRLLAPLPSPLDIPRCLWGLRPKSHHALVNAGERILCERRRGGEGYCVKEGGGGEGKCERELGCRKSDFALQALVECRALEPVDRCVFITVVDL
jgi:hypothetical protein